MNAYHPLDLEALYALDLPEPQWVVERLIPTGSSTLFSAREKAGKGLLTIDLCACIAFDEPFLDRAVLGGVAIYCAAEENTREVRSRIDARLRGRRNGPLFVLPLNGSTDDRLNLGDVEDIQRLENMIKEHSPRLVVIDTLREVHTGREDSSDDMAPLIKPITQIAHRQDTAILVTHHKNRGNTYRGSTAIGGAFDQLLEMTREEAEDSPTPVAKLTAQGRNLLKTVIHIKLGSDWRWSLADPPLRIAEISASDAVLRALAGSPAPMSAVDIKARIDSHSLKTLQNALSEMLKEDPPHVVAVSGAGAKGSPRLYQLARPALFLPEVTSIGGGSGRNNREEADDGWPGEWEEDLA